MKNNYRRNIGSVSRGVTPEETIPDFIWELKQMKPLRKEDRKVISQIEKRMESCRCEMPCKGRTLREYSELHENQYFSSEDAIQDRATLSCALENYALPYFFFGTDEENEYGFWLNPGELRESFDGLKVDDLSEVPKGYTGEVLHVNDHGNMTLYYYSRGKGRETWAIV